MKKSSESGKEEAIQQWYLTALRKQCKQHLKKAKTKKERMKLDNDLRMSYKHNDHHFLSNFKGK